MRMPDPREYDTPDDYNEAVIDYYDWLNYLNDSAADDAWERQKEDEKIENEKR